MLGNFIFVVHAALAIVLAFLMLLFPEHFTQLATGVSWANGPMADVALVYARFAAAGLILVAFVTGIAVRSASTRVRWAALISMLAISFVAIVLALFIPFPRMLRVTLIGNLAFLVAYLWAMFFHREEI